MQASTFTLATPDGVSLFVYRWLPDAPPKAVVQIVHGLLSMRRGTPAWRRRCAARATRFMPTTTAATAARQGHSVNPARCGHAHARGARRFQEL